MGNTNNLNVSNYDRALWYAFALCIIKPSYTPDDALRAMHIGKVGKNEEVPEEYEIY